MSSSIQTDSFVFILKVEVIKRKDAAAGEKHAGTRTQPK